MNALPLLPQDIWFHSLLPQFSSHTLYHLACVSTELNSVIWSLLVDLTFYKPFSSKTSCMGYLQRCPSLVSLGLSGIIPEPNDLETISNATFLTQLTIKNCALYPGFSFVVNKLTSLTSLIFSKTRLPDWDFKPLTSLCNLNNLTIQWCSGLTDVGLEGLQLFTKLERLSFYFIDISSTEPFRALTRLLNLSIEWCDGVTEFGCPELTRLETLHLAGAGIRDSRGLSSLSALQKLTTLDLTDCPISNNALVNLEPCQSLVCLTLQGAKNINDMGMKSIKKLTSLQELDLSGLRVSDVGLQRLSKLTKLQKLYLFNTEISLVDLLSLEPMGELTCLDLRSCTFTEQTVSMFIDLKQLHNLKRLFESGSLQI